jgi:hypothetical protein
LELFSLPQLMLDAPEMARVVGKARAKLLELYGDLEKVNTSQLHFSLISDNNDTNQSSLLSTVICNKRSFRLSLVSLAVQTCCSCDLHRLPISMLSSAAACLLAWYYTAPFVRSLPGLLMASCIVGVVLRGMVSAVPGAAAARSALPCSTFRTTK